jgi:hypothetical protein
VGVQHVAPSDARSGDPFITAEAEWEQLRQERRERLDAEAQLLDAEAQLDEARNNAIRRFAEKYPPLPQFDARECIDWIDLVTAVATEVFHPGGSAERQLSASDVDWMEDETGVAFRALRSERAAALCRSVAERIERQEALADEVVKWRTPRTASHVRAEEIGLRSYVLRSRAGFLKMRSTASAYVSLKSVQVLS